MKWFDIFLISFSHFKTRRGRNLITAAAVSLGVGAVVFLISLGSGLENATKVWLAQRENLSSLAVVSQDPEKPLDEAALAQIRGIKGVKAAAPTIALPAKVAYEDKVRDLVLYGVEEEELAEGIVGKVEAEEVLSVVVSEKTATTLSDNPRNLVGRELGLTLFVEEKGAEATSSATLAEKSLVGRVSGLNNKEAGLFTDIANLKSLGVSNFSRIFIAVQEKVDLGTITAEVENLGFKVENPVDLLSQVNFVLRGLKALLAAFGVLALVVASLGMFNTLTVSLLERTHEIGVMKALGATDWDIAKVFWLEAILLAIAGGIVGIVWGTLLGQLINLGLLALAKAQQAVYAPLFVTPIRFLIFAVVVSFLVGLITGYLPVRRSVKLPPMEALRYE